MNLIVDCGSTKADWTFIEGGKIVSRCVTNGFNPNFNDIEIFSNITLNEVCKNIDIKYVTNVYFYGTGCGNEANVSKIKAVLNETFTYAKIDVFSDILGSCHALFGNKHGIACILGTGSNACLYDGNKITKKAVSLGYVLGDEGSGCNIGRRLVHDYFYGIMPSELRAKFNREYNLDVSALINKVYNEPQPSQYLASFSKFAGENIDNQYIIDLLKDVFTKFLKFMVEPLIDNKNQGFKVSFIGSIAFHFKDILRQCVEKEGLIFGEVIQSPMEGLIEFHCLQYHN